MEEAIPNVGGANVKMHTNEYPCRSIKLTKCRWLEANWTMLNGEGMQS